MSITTETATVFRGGGRRWFTKKSAINAEAKAAYNKSVQAHGVCECGSQFIDGIGEIDDHCPYHDWSNPVRGRYMRFAKYCLGKTV